MYYRSPRLSRPRCRVHRPRSSAGRRADCVRFHNWVLHKITDANVVAHLRRVVGGIDDSLWKRLPGLAPGQAIVSFTSMARQLLVAIDPAPCRLRMIE
jgi:hypothetical protein